MTAIEINIDRARAARFARQRGFPKRQIEDIEHRRARTNRQQAAVWSSIWKPLRNGSMVYMHGDRGVGKTFMACGLAIVWNEHEYHERTRGFARYWHALDLFTAIIDWQQNKPKNPYTEKLEPSPLALAEHDGLLVLDELGEIKYSEFQTTTLSALLDKRYRNNRPTLLIANQGPRDLNTLGMPRSVLSRITDGGAAIHCKDWPNMRGNVA